MNNESSSQIEQALRVSYETQAKQYADALTVATELQQQFRSGGHIDEPLGKLAALLENVGQMERQMQELKTSWRQAGLPPGAELKNVLVEVETLLKQLIGQIKIAEDFAQQAKERLMPQMDSQSRTKKMQKAYKPHSESQTRN